jgi:hypothetical protein
MKENDDYNTGSDAPLSYIAPQKEITLTFKKKKKPEKISLDYFDLDSVVDNGSYVLIGKRGAGKSWMIRDIIGTLWNAQKIDACIVFSPTDRMNSFYSKFVPEQNVYFEFQLDAIKSILMEQINTNKEKHVCIVMDDCLSSRGNWAKDEVLADLFLNARHYNITLVLTMQFSLGLRPEHRSNFDYVFLLADDTLSNQKRLYDHYAGIFPNFDSFRQTFIQATNNYSGLCLLNSKKACEKFEDKVNYFKVQSEKDFIIDNVLLIKNDSGENLDAESIKSEQSLEHSEDSKSIDQDSLCSLANENYLNHDEMKRMMSTVEMMSMLSSIVETNNKITEMNGTITNLISQILSK